MKLFKKTILALMAVAVSAGFTACSDDDDYSVGQQSPGAYFPNDAPATIQVPVDDNSFSVEVFRTSVDAPTTYGVTATDPSGAFSVPATVTFEAHSLVSELVISIKEPLDESKTYPLTLTLDGGSLYGLTKYEATVKVKASIIRSQFGVGTYIYNGCYSGGQAGVPVFASYDEKTPNVVTWEIGGPVGTEDSWGGGYNLFVTFEDFKADEISYCRVAPQYVVTDTDDGSEIYVADYANYQYETGRDGASYVKDSYFDPETGLLTLHAIYYIPGTNLWFGDNYEYMQLDGYPDYSVSVEYAGMYISPESEISLIGKFETSSDPSRLLAVCMLTNDPNVALNAILAETDDVHELAVGEPVTEMFKSQGPGNYVMMGVTYDTEGEPMELDYVQFEVTGAVEDPNLGWSDLGSADFADGWVMAAFSRGGVPIVVADEMFPVDIQQNDDDPTLFRMVQPWGENFPIASLNAYPKKRNIEFVIDGTDYVCFEEQLSGYGTANWGGELSIGNLTGYLRGKNPDASNATIANAIKTNYPDELSTYEDGVLTVPEPMFGAPGVGDGTFGYTWKNIQASVMYMPDVPANVKALNKAKRVAAPKYVGVRAQMRAQRSATVEKAKKMRLPFEANPNHRGLQLKRK